MYSKSKLMEMMYGHFTRLPTIGGGIQTRANIFGGVDITTPTGKHLATLKDNISGGQDIFSQDMQQLGAVRSNIFGGQDLISPTQQPLLSSQPNIAGGQDYYTPEFDRVASTQANIHGGQDVFDGGHQLLGSSQPNILGGETFLPQAAPGGVEIDPSLLAPPYLGAVDFEAGDLGGIPEPPEMNLFPDLPGVELPELPVFEPPPLDAFALDVGGFGDLAHGGDALFGADFGALDAFSMDFDAFDVPDFDFDFDF